MRHATARQFDYMRDWSCLCAGAESSDWIRALGVKQVLCLFLKPGAICGSMVNEILVKLVVPYVCSKLNQAGTYSYEISETPRVGVFHGARSRPAT
jgi:hypothetical protein